jgi:SNF2 family DNA or RNA helicase
MDASHPDFQCFRERFPKVVVIANPEAGGMALTLTAAPTEIFYSNSFKFEARGQAEDRAHRPGMDSNRGLTIIDFVMLPTDKLVIDNLKKKKVLQDMSMGELRTAFQDTSTLEAARC